MLRNIKDLYLHCVFHGIRFKVSNEDWSSVKMAFSFLDSILISNSPRKNFKSSYLSSFFVGRIPK